MKRYFPRAKAVLFSCLILFTAAIATQSTVYGFTLEAGIPDNYIGVATAPIPGDGSCATFNAATNSVRIPCLDYLGYNLWVDLGVTAWAPIIQGNVLGYGGENLPGSSKCATFDSFSNTALIPCVDYLGNNLWAYLGVVSWDPIMVDVRGYGTNDDNDTYNIGNPVLTDIWVDPLNGNDSNTGSSRTNALRTITAAWGRIPAGTVLSGTGYRIQLVRGEYPESAIPNWMEARYGTFAYPVIIQAADGSHTVKLHGYLNINDVRYLYLIDLDFVTDPGYGGGGNVVHIANGNHILIRRCTLSGYDGSVRQPQETLKVNQTQYIYIEESEFSGASWFSLDFVAVDYGHIRESSIYDASEDCVVIKGGSSNIRVEGNKIYNCNAVGFTAGQGTGFEYMTSPWLHYEAYDIKFINNVVYNVQNAGIAARGGYNILAAYNTLYRVGYDARGAGLLLISPGSRSCDGDAPACAARHLAGGWGPVSVGDGGEWIPNRNVFIYNNIFYNPAPTQTIYNHFVIYGPAYPPSGTNIPSPSLSDNNLQIKGNIIWNGPVTHPLGAGGAGEGCQTTNTTCNATQLISQNSINTVNPQLVNPIAGDFHPVSGGNVFSTTAYSMPNFSGGDRPQPPLAPVGDLNNTVTQDRDECQRNNPAPSGAYAKSSTTCL